MTRLAVQINAPRMMSMIDKVIFCMKETLRRAYGDVRDIDALAKLQVDTYYPLNLPGNIEVLEGFLKVTKEYTMFQKACTAGMLMGVQ